eukprot:c9088_g1_i1 orf=55-498(-)
MLNQYIQEHVYSYLDVAQRLHHFFFASPFHQSLIVGCCTQFMLSVSCLSLCHFSSSSQCSSNCQIMSIDEVNASSVVHQPSMRSKFAIVSTLLWWSPLSIIPCICSVILPESYFNRSEFDPFSGATQYYPLVYSRGSAHAITYWNHY